jgi:DedD protein
MNEVLKQRLVGALILVALGVVFWPIIFVEPGGQGGADEARIPPRPQVDTTPIETPGIAGLRPSPDLVKELTPATEPSAPNNNGSGANPAAASKRPVAAASDSPAEAAAAAASEKMAASVAKTRSEPPARPVVDGQGIPVVWILRVASVSSSARADELRKRLLDMGHKAYAKKIKSGDKTLYRVYVGPKAEKARLEKIQREVDAEFGVNTIITRYYP